jgi:hypothetical protein
MSSSKAIWSRSFDDALHPRGDFLGVTAAGMQVTVTLVDVCRVVDGRVVEHWGGERRLRVAVAIALRSSLTAQGVPVTVTSTVRADPPTRCGLATE